MSILCTFFVFYTLHSWFGFMVRRVVFLLFRQSFSSEHMLKLRLVHYGDIGEHLTYFPIGLCWSIFAIKVGHHNDDFMMWQWVVIEIQEEMKGIKNHKMSTFDCFTLPSFVLVFSHRITIAISPNLPKVRTYGNTHCLEEIPLRWTGH